MIRAAIFFDDNDNTKLFKNQFMYLFVHVSYDFFTFWSPLTQTVVYVANIFETLLQLAILLSWLV